MFTAKKLGFRTKIRLRRMGVGCAALLALTGLAHGRPTTNQVVSIAGMWRYTTNQVDASNWTVAGYDDTAWSGPSNALFAIESAQLPAAKNTLLPARSNGKPVSCYSFRTTFLSGSLKDLVALHFTHLTDDGAVFYLNGAEVQRIRMEAGPLGNSTEAHTTPPGGDATSFESFTLVGKALTNLVEGANVLAVRVHQHGTESTDVVFGAQVSVIRDPNPEVRLTRGPYLQVCTPSSVILRWRTDLAEDSRVAFGTALSGVTDHAVLDAERVAEHVVTVTNLTPDTLYVYSIGSSARVLAGGDGTCSFRTHPLPGHPKALRLWVTGDAGTADENAQAVRDAFESANGTRAVHAWLQLADNAYSDGTDEEYQAALFDMYSARLRQTPVWVTIGNHETYSTGWNGLYPYLNNFTVPTLGEAGGVASHTMRYYSFDIGMAHFISLDSMTSDRSTGGAMANWLRADLAATTNRWVIAFFHHPPYTKGSHDSDVESELVEMREAFAPILESGGVDLVLSGHSHCYERSYLLNGHYGDSSSLTGEMILDGGSGREINGAGAYIKPEHAVGPPVGNRGTVYAVVGCSGKISGGDLDHPAMLYSQNTLGSLVLDILPDRLNAMYLRETGATNDWFSIVKTNFAPVASNQVCTVSAGGTSEIRLAAGDLNRNPITFSVTTLPTNGLVSGFNAASGALAYTPARGTGRGDRIGFVATDGALVSVEGTVTVQVQLPRDADSDGLSDDWESLYGITDHSGDPDRDGATNLHEYLAGTDPRDAQSLLKMTESAHGAGGFRVSWASVGGTRYRIRYSDGGGSGGFDGEFSVLSRAVMEEMDPHPWGAPGTMSFVDDFTLTGVPPHGSRFYVISVVAE